MAAMRRASALLLVMLAVGAVGAPASAKNVNVSIRDNVYDMHFRVILEGDTITWRNDGENEHTVTAFPGSRQQFDSSPESDECIPNANPPIIGNDPDDCMDPGGTYPVKFAKPGTYEYYCKVHGDPSVRPNPNRANDEQPCRMCGIIQVKADEQKSPTVTPTATETRRASSPSPTPTASASPSPSPTAPDGAGGSGEDTVAAGGSGDDGGGLGRGAIALLVIMGLSGAGWWTWKKYLAPS